MYRNMKLTFLQMYNIGMHLGYTLNMSKFLSYWIFGGWRNNIFMINLVKTSFYLKASFDNVHYAVSSYSPVWFMNLDLSKTAYVTSYSMLAGEPYATYNWIDGTLTNYKSMMHWYNLMYSLVKSLKYKLSHSDKMKMLSFFGFMNHSFEWPSMCFVTSTLKSWKVMSECWVVGVPCIGMVDSNVLSWNMSLPVPGSDDSLICLNYYCFIYTSEILYYKVKSVNLFKYIVQRTEFSTNFLDSIAKKKKMMLLHFYKRRGNWSKLKKKILLKSFLNNTSYMEGLKFNWRMKDLKVDMGMFNTKYNGFSNKDFFKSFGYKDHKWLLEENQYFFFLNDPYSIY